MFVLTRVRRRRQIWTFNECETNWTTTRRYYTDEGDVSYRVINALKLTFVSIYYKSRARLSVWSTASDWLMDAASWRCDVETNNLSSNNDNSVQHANSINIHSFKTISVWFIILVYRHDHTWGLDSSTGCATTGDVMCDIIGEFLDIVNVTVSAESFQ